MCIIDREWNAILLPIWLCFGDVQIEINNYNAIQSVHERFANVALRDSKLCSILQTSHSPRLVLVVLVYLLCIGSLMQSFCESRRRFVNRRLASKQASKF